MALRRLRHHLYGVQFRLETDARVLITQLDGSTSYLPRAPPTRWLAWINLFDFGVVHVPGKKHTAAGRAVKEAALDHLIRMHL